EAGGSSVQVNQLSGGRISNGAIVERAVPTALAPDGTLFVELDHTDFGTAQNVVESVNRHFGFGTASAVDGRRIQVRVPQDPGHRVAFLSQLENLQIARAPVSAK